MGNKQSFELGHVSRTLVLPLWGRAREHRKPHPIISDTKAADIVDRLNFDFTALDTDGNKGNQIAWVARAWNIDRALRRFSARHDETTVVNVGCGLDTTYERVDDGEMLWYEIDLPAVIELRKKLLMENDRRTFIAASVVEPNVFENVKEKGSVIIIAAGLLYYFKEDEVKMFFQNIKRRFPSAEIVFDACSPLGMKVANKKVIAENGMDASAALNWALKGPRAIHKLGLGLKIIESYPLFKKVMHRIEKPMRMTARISDFFKILFMMQVAFKGSV